MLGNRDFFSFFKTTESLDFVFLQNMFWGGRKVRFFSLDNHLQDIDVVS